MERRFSAPPDAVFDAWTNPDVLQRWWAAGPGWATPLAEVRRMLQLPVVPPPRAAA